MNKFLLLVSRARLAAKAVRLCLALSLLNLFGLVPAANAQIVLDFSDDFANQRFFTNNPVARAAVEAAAADLNAAIIFDLDAVEDITNGSAGTTSLDFDFNYNYLNPATNAEAIILDTTLLRNEYRVFVGARTLTGGTDAPLGEGGTGGVGFSAAGVIGSGSIANAIADAEANDTHRRGGGPLVRISNSVFDTGDQVSFTFGLTIGSLVMNDNVNWHFDHTTPVTAGANDFYSVALHELLHTLGVGASEAWSSQISGRNWLGAEAIAANGTGTTLVAPDGDHFTESIMSQRITDGVLQETVIDPDLTLGTRRELTVLDLAVLRDLGFETNVFDVPDPVLLGDVNLDGSVSFLDISPFISILSTGGFQEEADINADDAVNFLDISPFIGLLSAQ